MILLDTHTLLWAFGDDEKFAGHTEGSPHRDEG